MGHALPFAARPESSEPGLFSDFVAFPGIPPIVEIGGNDGVAGNFGGALGVGVKL
jgi:hypothetical protein